MKTKTFEPNGSEPKPCVYGQKTYDTDIGKSFNWYNQERERKDARDFIKAYVKANYSKDLLSYFNTLPDSRVNMTYGWAARILTLGGSLSPKHLGAFQTYMKELLTPAAGVVIEDIEEEAVSKKGVRENTEGKAREYIGELEGRLDDYLSSGKEFDLGIDLKSKTVPMPYCSYIKSWLDLTLSQYIFVYETDDPDYKEGYSNIGKRKLTGMISLLGQWVEDLNKYAQFKKANRKPRIKKVKPPSVQAAKVKYKKEDTELGVKSIHPSEIVGAEQVWIYNTKYKRLAAYRCDSSQGIQIKGTTLQNYDPDMSDHKSLRKPKEVLKSVLSAGKIQLRRIFEDLTTKDMPLNGRINEECIIVRVIK